VDLRGLDRRPWADPSPARLVRGYEFAAAMMIVAGVVEAIYGVEAARRSLEDVATPLSVSDG